MSRPPASPGADGACQATEARLKRIGALADEEIDLAETALLLAALDDPEAPLAPYREHLAELVQGVAEAGRALGAEASLSGRTKALRRVLFERHRYSGDRETYDDLQNANLMRVIERRKGLPVALGLLYIDSAAKQGWNVAGINFPGHFLVRLGLGQDGVILDPFHDGIARDSAQLRSLLKSMAGAAAELAPEHYARVGRRDVLLRLQNNVRLRMLRDGRKKGAAAALESMLLVRPDSAALWREAGELQAELGNLRHAIESLERALELTPEGARRAALAQALRQLHGRLH